MENELKKKKKKKLDTFYILGPHTVSREQFPKLNGS